LLLLLEFDDVVAAIVSLRSGEVASVNLKVTSSSSAAPTDARGADDDEDEDGAPSSTLRTLFSGDMPSFSTLFISSSVGGSNIEGANASVRGALDPTLCVRRSED
jgi:hypothetical protein